MIETITGLPAGIDGVRCAGKLTREEYDAVVAPLVHTALGGGHRLRTLIEVESFDGITPAAAFEDVTLGLQAIRCWDGCAVVTDLGWVAELTPLSAFLMPFPVKVFPVADRDRAVEWLQQLPAAARIRHRILPEAGVLVVEVGEAISARDVEALAEAVDGWLTAHPTLHGLVLHARTVPGWANVEGLVRHVRFVASHQSRIERLALAIDGPIATIGATVADRVVHPDVRKFAFTDVEAAIVWASEK